ncbi:MAG: transketolase [Acidobacteria bacterium]|nr:MAG: transketolase [Acidobacteriota bacterium]
MQSQCNYEEALIQLARNDDRIIVLTAENRASIRNLPEFMGRRFLDTGIAEQTMIGMAAGLALCGRIPVAHALAAFLTMRAFEFIRTDIGIPCLSVKLIGSFAGIFSEANGPTHQALEDISLMGSIPGMEIYCPADEQQMTQVLQMVIWRRRPAYIRYTSESAAVEHGTFQPGHSEILQHGEDAMIFTFGPLLRQAFEAAQILRSSGISAGVINLCSIVPLDEDQIVRSARRVGLIVTIEDHFLYGGLYSRTCEVLVRNGVRTNVLPIGFEEKWFRPGLLADVLDYHGLTGPQIADKIRRKL